MLARYLIVKIVEVKKLLFLFTDWLDKPAKLACVHVYQQGGLEVNRSVTGMCGCEVAKIDTF